MVLAIYLSIKSSLKNCIIRFVPMMKNFTAFIFLLLTTITVFGQGNNATLKGVIKDSEGVPIDMVAIVLQEFPTLETTTNAKGEYLLRIPAKKQLTVISNHSKIDKILKTST